MGAGYFSTLGMELLAGREFTIADGEGAPTVALVNEAFARKFNLDGRNAVGKFMSTTSNTDSLTIQIVGLIRDAKYSDVKQEVPPLFFLPWVQQEEAGSLHFYVKTSLDPTQVMQPIRAVINRLDPNLPLQELKTLDQQVRENVFMDRMITTLAGAFALLATVLAATGLYGILAYTVAQRTREIGLRMALGADAEKVRGMVLKQMTLMLAVGGFIGVVGALALGQAAESLLYGMTGMDPVVVVSGVMFLSLIAMAAAFIPARRASLVDPMVALRYE